MTRRSGRFPCDGNALSLYGFPPTSFALVIIEDNSIRSNDEAIEILSNDPPKSSRIAIRRNDIDTVFDIKGIYPFHYVIFINDNILKTDQVLIEDNSIRVKNISVCRVRDMGVFVLTGTNYLVRQNQKRIELLDNFDGQIFRFGSGGNLVVIDFGMSLTDSVVESNKIVGSYQGDGIFFSGGIRKKNHAATSSD